MVALSLMKPRTLIFTGDGKGKTTAALGMALRAGGHGQRVLIVQFLKTDSTGELTAIQHLPGVKIIQMGRGFVPKETHPEFPQHRQAAEAALIFSEQAVASGDWDMVILDEICGAVALKLLHEDAVLSLLGKRVEGCVLVLTGRGATERLIAEADTVTKMESIKHGFTQGIKAQKGVEY